MEGRGLLGDDAPWMRSRRSKWNACMARRMYTDKNRSIQKSRYIKEVQYTTHECDFSFRIGIQHSVFHHTAWMQESEDCKSPYSVSVSRERMSLARSLVDAKVCRSLRDNITRPGRQTFAYIYGDSIHVASRFTLARFSAPASAPSTTTRHSTAA